MAIDKSDHKAAGTDRLVNAVRRMKINDAERNDVVVDMKEADRARLELLAERLSDVFDAVPFDDDRFDFALSSGLQPRLWIDATAHVMMGRDRRMFRFVRDTRLGRVILGESGDIDRMADHVTDYIAERILERERALAGETVALRVAADSAGADAKASAVTDQTKATTTLLPVVKRRADDDAVGYDDAPPPANKTNTSAAEPSLKRAFSNLLWVLIGLGLGGGALLYALGQIG
ncbi:MAG: hypothetical protein WA921_11185 [Ahrensia sp.]